MSFNRNQICHCGSRQKFKHCCGAISREALRPTNEQLSELAVTADDEGLALGEEPNQRAFMNITRILTALGIESVQIVGEGSPEIVKRVHAANDRLFRNIDKREGGIHLGFFMFRDIFCRLYVPIVYGSPNVNFLDYLDLSEHQKEWMSEDAEVMARFMDQSFDLFDFAYGLMEFGHKRPANDRSKELIYRAHVQLEAAAATATSAYNYRGTLQSALLGAEMALKAGLAFHGYDDKMLRNKVGHDLSKAAELLGSIEQEFDAQKVVKAVSTFPDFAMSRYGGPQPDRREMGHILMKAQYVASEVTRTFTDRDIRCAQTDLRLRFYPN